MCFVYINITAAEHRKVNIYRSRDMTFIAESELEYIMTIIIEHI